MIEAVGEGVAKAWMGERVWVYLAGWQTPVGHRGRVHGRAGREGGAARRRVLRARRVARRPRAHRLPLPVLRRPDRGPARARRGRRGRRRPRAIELAKWGGAEVVTTVSSAEKAELASAADVIVNYREDGAAEQIGKVDRIVEVALGPNLELDLAVANPHATIVTYAADQPTAELPIRAADDGEPDVARSCCSTRSRSRRKHDAIGGVSKAVEAGALTTLPLHRFPLAETAAAHDAVENGAVGKVVIDTGESLCTRDHAQELPNHRAGRGDELPAPARRLDPQAHHRHRTSSPILGPIHGALFVAYVALAILLRPEQGWDTKTTAADPARRRGPVRRLRRGPLAHVVFPIACSFVGRIVSSGTNARGGRFTANTHAAATSSGISIWSRTSRDGRLRAGCRGSRCPRRRGGSPCCGSRPRPRSPRRASAPAARPWRPGRPGPSGPSRSRRRCR